MDQIPCTLESVRQFCFDYGALNCVQEREMEDSRRILCEFCSPGVLRAVLWLAVGLFGNVRGDPLQNEFPDQIPRRALANARQTIEND